jgi:ferric-chelate reductase
MKQCNRQGLSLQPSRPKIRQTLDLVILRAISLGPGAKSSETLSGVIVGACGPVSLGDDISEAVRQVDNHQRKAVGGVELYEE